MIGHIVDILENKERLQLRNRAVLTSEHVPGVEVVGFEKFTTYLIAVLSTPGF